VIAAIGTLALVVGVAASIAASVLWTVVALSGTRLAAARMATATGLAAAVISCGALEWALITHDFTVSYVAENGGRTVPLYFTVTSLWSALDGSLLLWLLILSGAAAALATGRSSESAPERAWASVTVAIVSVFFYALAYFAANPFEHATAVPFDGPGPNPLLREHPAMGVHPPLLYAGYVGMVVPFGYAIAALVRGRRDDRWLLPARRWALGAWVLLTAGIMLGAWWSYAVLGWGGYWAWDPVENASLLPWLTATAALHLTAGRARRSSLAGWAAVMFCATFILVLVGTFLTRSGAVDSVHSFTQSPLGPMLLGFVVLVFAVVTGLLLRGDNEPITAGHPPRWRSRDGGFLCQAVLLTAIAAVVLTGTLYPLLNSLISGSRSAVEASYYSRTAVPLFLAVLLLMGVVQLVPRRAAGTGRLSRRLLAPASAGLTVIVLFGISSPDVSPLALVAFGLASFVLTGVATVWFCAGHRAARPGLLAHSGIALVTIGIAASSSFALAQLGHIAVGESVTAGGVTASLVGIDRHSGADRMTATARLALEHDGRRIGDLSPVLNYYPARDMTVGVPAIQTRPHRDIYATATRIDDDGATIRLAVNPFVSLIWIGAAVAAVGGVLAWRRRARPSLPAEPQVPPVATAAGTR
jgi:cytochrome c-type biogenesis protein CcmF